MKKENTNETEIHTGVTKIYLISVNVQNILKENANEIMRLINLRYVTTGGKKNIISLINLRMKQNMKIYMQGIQPVVKCSRHVFFCFF